MVEHDRRRQVTVTIHDVELPGVLRIPAEPLGVVVFAHGSGSSRFSTRNSRVAETLQNAGFATLLFDLLTAAEAEDRRNVFDVPLLGQRLFGATASLAAEPDLGSVPIGCFGASTGAAAALWAAAGDPRVQAVVSRGGRPDLAASRLGAVRAPTLLIVGGLDRVVLELNEEARRLMLCESELRIVPGATHLFEEPGALGQVAALARDWFLRHLAGGVDPQSPGGRRT